MSLSVLVALLIAAIVALVAMRAIYSSNIKLEAGPSPIGVSNFVFSSLLSVFFFTIVFLTGTAVIQDVHVSRLPNESFEQKEEIPLADLLVGTRENGAMSYIALDGTIHARVTPYYEDSPDDDIHVISAYTETDPWIQSASHRYRLVIQLPSGCGESPEDKRSFLLQARENKDTKDGVGNEKGRESDAIDQ